MVTASYIATILYYYIKWGGCSFSQFLPIAHNIKQVAVHLLPYRVFIWVIARVQKQPSQYLKKYLHIIKDFTLPKHIIHWDMVVCNIVCIP